LAQGRCLAQASQGEVVSRVPPPLPFSSFNVAAMVQASMALLVMAAAVLQGGQAGTAVANADTTGGANPVRRVVSLLQSMASKLQAEAEKEKELYDKFMCYCKTSGGDLAKSISESTTKVPQLQSDIEQAEASLKQLQQDLKTHAEDRSAAKAAMGSATAQREKEHSQFVEVSTEYTSYLTALNQAIPAIEKGMGGGFVQTGTGAQLRQAVLKDSSVTDYDRQLVTAFLSGSSSDKYVPKSGEITGILNQIKEDFEKNLAEVTSAEEEAVKIHEDLMAAKSKQVSALGAEIERKTTRTGELQVDIVNMKNELTQTEAALVEDKQFAADLDKNCGSKTAEWDEREKTRGEELVAIHDTIKILNDDDALELFKKTLPSPSLLQLKAGIAQRRQKALAALRNPRRGRAELDFVALALSGRKVDFSKVIKMIDDMVALLKNEQLDDEHKKDYCEKQIDMTEDKAKDLNKRVQDLDAAIAEKEEAMTALAAEIKELTEGIAELDKSVSEATEQRKKEHAEFQELMSSNGAAKELLAYAKNRLNKFYNPGLYKEAPKKELSRQEKIASNFGGDEEVASMFVQVSRHSQHANRDAPPAPPGTWDAYSKKSQESAGVIGMIDLLVKDLDREMTEAETSEKEGQKQYEVTMSDAAKKRAADLKSLAAKERSKADFEEGKAADTDSMRVKSKELQATKMYEMQLHQECDWLMENFDLRKQAREEESDSLKQAKAVLAGADFSLMQSAASGRAATPRRLRGF